MSFGTLVVANSGNPFSHSNFESLRKVAVSDKPPEEAIGNKGIGFKSVVEVCDSPAVYSAWSTENRVFDGYCFRFPRPEDVGQLITHDPDGAQQVADEMLLLGLPIPAQADEPWLDRIAHAGYVTVVALPLRSAAAEQSVLEQLASLVDDTALILLFLDRVAELRVVGRRAEDDQVDSEVVLTRSTVPPEAGGICRQVDLGTAGTYVVATSGLSSDDLAEALQESMDLRLVDRRWDDWHGEVEVSAAVRIDAPIGVGRRYTHLPMGPDATSPVAAHLDAPFYANISRTDAIEDVPFNARLMDELAYCCLLAAVEMRGAAEPWARAASVDFLAWDADQQERWQWAADAVELSPADDPLVPTESTLGPGWATFEQDARWVELTDDRTHVVTADAVIAAGALLADGALGEDRLDRLDVVGWWAGKDLTLDDDQMADWIAAIAAALDGSPFRSHEWEAFYDDLAELDLPAAALSGRAILLTSAGELRQAGERRGRGVRKGIASVTFFNPADDDEDPLTLEVPPSLRDEIAFMHRGIDWNLRDGHVRKRPGREYLERAGLVQDYRADGVITALRQLLTNRRAKGLHADALQFAFDLFRGVPPDKQKAFARVPFLLPSRSQKLIPAEQALLAPTWGTPAGALLGELITRCGSMAEEVGDLEARLFDPPDGLEPSADCVAYLLAIGVTDGLPTVPLAMPSPTVEGRWAKDQAWLGTQMGLTELDAQRWQEDVHDRGLGELRGWTAYRFSHPPQALVAQTQLDALDARGTELFAELVAHGLSSWPDSTFRVTLQKVSRPLENPQTMPTPLASFLRYAPWIPVAEAGQRDDLSFAAPADVWHHTGRDQRPPAFAALASRRFRAAALDGRVLARLRDLGLNVWDDPDDAAALVAHLGDLLYHDGIRLTAAGEFKNHYASAWHDVVTRGDVDPFEDVEQPFLVATIGHELQAVDVDDRTEPLVVPCTTGHGVTDRLELLGVTVVPVDPADGSAVFERLHPRLGDVVVRSDDVEVTVVVDGEPLDPTAGVPLIVPERDWLATLILTALELGGSRFRRRGEEGLRNAADRLRLARVVFATEAQVRTGMGGSIHQVAPSRPLAVDHDEAPIIVVVGTSHWSWQLLESLREPIADLLRQPDLAATIGYALVQLQRELDGPAFPSIDDVTLTSTLLAQLLGVPEHDVDQVRQTLRSSLVSVLERLYPALCVLVGDDAAAVFDPEAPGLDDRDAVLSALQALGDQLATSIDVSVDDLLSAAEDAIPMHEFVDRVGLDFETFNAVLSRLAERGLPYTPMHNVDGHLRVFEAFVTEHREAISDRLRERSLDEYHSGGDLAGYLVARRIDLAPDPDWLDRCWDPSEVGMSDRVRAWLVEQGAEPDLERPSDLRPLLDVHQHNSQLVLELAARAVPILAAWIAKQGGGVSIPHLWTAKESAYEVDRDATAAGIKDFEPLDEVQVLAWLAASGRWPDAMPSTLDLHELGLTAEDVEAAGRQPEPAPYRPPELEFGDGETVVAGEAGFSDLMRLVESQLTSDLLGASDAYASLTEPLERSRGRGGGGSVTAGRNNVPDELKGSIGLIGEVCALRWLAHRYRLDGDDHWVSGYRNLVLGGNDGNDALGYDFVVERSGDHRPFYFEVKTSTGPATAFEFPDVEVRAAQEHWRKDEYRIILVTNALDPDTRRLQVLPNPFSREGAPYYRVMGRGIQYGFRFAE